MLQAVFISYRQESPEHDRAVRRLGELLRQAKIPVALDQFFLEEHPGGPDAGWPKWCEDRANESACVLIIASEGWFAAYNKTAPPHTGTGAATEADLIRQWLYDEKADNTRIRLVFLHEIAADKVPPRLRGWHQFRPFESDDQLDRLLRWVAHCVGMENPELPTVRWPEPASFRPDFADRVKEEWPAVVELLTTRSRHRILLYEGASGLGKSVLVRQAAAYAKKLGIGVALVDFKGGPRDVLGILGQLYLEIGDLLPNFSRQGADKSHLLRGDLRKLRQPVLVIFDSYEDVANNPNIADWLNQQFFTEFENALGVAAIVAGQQVPDYRKAGWRDLVRHVQLEPIAEIEHWAPWVNQQYPDFRRKGADLRTVLMYAGGIPFVVSQVCEAISTRSGLHFLQTLEQTQGDTRSQATLTAEFLLASLPEAEQQAVRDTLDAAALLRWFDDDLLGEVLQIPSEDARRRSEALDTFSFVERYRKGEEEVRYIYEATRLGWRKKIAGEDPARFRELSSRSASCFVSDSTPAGRIEWIYHLLCGDSDLGASELEKLDGQWSSSARSDDRYALATALQELEDTQLLQGRARARGVLWIARTRVMRGEVGELVGVLTEVLKLARDIGDKSAQAEAMRLEGDVRQAQGDLIAAQAAFEESLAIRRGLAEEDRGNAVWQRELAVTLGRTGDVLLSQGELDTAQATFEESLAISQQLAEQDPSNIGRKRDLAIARGRMALIQLGKGAVAHVPTHEEKRQIFEHHFLFRKLNASEIDSLIAYSRIEWYRAGREIYAKGSPGQSMMAVLRGTIKMSSLSNDGKEIVFDVINPGQIFGEISVLDGEERSSDAVAMTDCELLVLNRPDLMRVLESRPDILMTLVRILCRRVRQAREQVEDVIFRHLESRLAKALLQLAEVASLQSGPGSSIELRVSQRELGNMAGGSRESVNKHLWQWHKRGLIGLSKGSIMIFDVAALTRLI